MRKRIQELQYVPAGFEASPRLIKYRGFLTRRLRALFWKLLGTCPCVRCARGGEVEERIIKF